MNLHADKMALFAEVARAGSFTAAAMKLALPKSTVSERITSLEKRLEVRLLNRSTRSLSLTWAGEKYLEKCEALLDLLNEADDTIEQIKADENGELRITTAGRFSEMALPDLLVNFQKVYPKVTFDIVVEDAPLDLIKNRFDIAFRTGDLKDSSLVSYQLLDNQKFLVASEDYLQHTPIDTLDDLSNANAIIHPGYPVWKMFHGTQTKTVRPKASIKVNNMIFAKNLCEKGGGITVLAEGLINSSRRRPPLQHILPDWKIEANALYIVYPSRKHNTPAFKAFTSYVIEHYSRFYRAR